MPRFGSSDGSAGRARRGPSGTSAVAKFAIGGLAALAAVAVGSYFLMRHIGTNEAISNAEEVTRIVGRQIVQPKVRNDILRERPAGIQALDRVVRGAVLSEDIVRVKIWTRGGRIVYSDEHRLIGSKYELDPDDVRALTTGGVDASVSDLSRPENRFERSQGDLMEVYLGIRAPNGRPLLFETYQRFSSIAASGSSIWKAFAPALVGALLILAILQVPLAASMARRLRRGHMEREALLRRAIEASDRERRRIAGDLHDGVVQNLAGTALSLDAAAARTNGTDGNTRGALERGAAQTRQSVRELRSMLVEIYPPSLRAAGLESALADLLAPLGARGIDARLDVALGLELTPETEATVYRVAQEAVRNAAAHAAPNEIVVAVGRTDGGVSLDVADDGRGMPGNGESPSGHFGISLMRDLAADASGTIRIDSAPGRGTRVHLEVPAP
jgi:two-component system, NarL family, sensor kinase